MRVCLSLLAYERTFFFFFLRFVRTMEGFAYGLFMQVIPLRPESLSGESGFTVRMHTLEPHDLMGLKLCIKDACMLQRLVPVMRPLERWG